MARYSFNQPMCLVCWRRAEGDRDPTRLKED
jgi:hypothetical protein